MLTFGRIAPIKDLLNMAAPFQAFAFGARTFLQISCRCEFTVVKSCNELCAWPATTTL
jgi:hypothetical protein